MPNKRASFGILQPQLVLIGSGIFLIVLGLLHIPVWLADGSSWEGAVSWRKPILFGTSTGLTLWSLGWIVSALKQNRFDQIVSFTTAFSLVVEVGLITLQQWRGTASHFNQATVMDARIDIAMLVLICIAVAGILYIGIRTFGKLHMDDEYKLATRLGMVFLFLSCVIGFVISAHGYEQVEANMPSETYGENGVTKFPHGVAIHVLQILPILSLLLRKFGIRPALRRQATWAVAGSHVCLLAFACVQTLAGRDRFELNTVIGIGLLCAAFMTVAIPVISILRDRVFLSNQPQSGASK